MPLPLLTLSGKEKDRQKMIESALHDLAPKTYQDLKSQGNLQSFVKNHEQAMMESYEDAKQEEFQKILHPKNPNINRAPQLDMAAHRLWEETLATWLDFSDPDESSTIGSSREE
jgi:hypothetical protein